MKYHLLSSGRLPAGFKEKESLARIQQITKLSEEQVRKSLLQGGPKKLLASDDKEKIQKAALALRKAGLDVKVNSRRSGAKVPADGGPGAIAILSGDDIEERKKKRIDFLPPVTARKTAPKKKKACSESPLNCLIHLFLFLIILTGVLSL